MPGKLAMQKVQAGRRLPGISPVGQVDWITVDQGYAAQVAEKQRLIADRVADVYQMRPAAEAAAVELLAEVLVLLRARSDFGVDGAVVQTPDGRAVDTADGPPLLVLSQILQEDFCIHLKDGGEHHLMGALMCFPASWTLAEKIGQPLTRIHAPVDEYDAGLAQRVQRLFDGVKVGQPMWRANYLTYPDPVLFQPKHEWDDRHGERGDDAYVRSERQTILRLPQSQAVVFAIHTTVVLRSEV